MGCIPENGASSVSGHWRVRFEAHCSVDGGRQRPGVTLRRGRACARRPQAGRVDGQGEGPQHVTSSPGTADDCVNAHDMTAFRALERLDAEHPPHEIGPGIPVARAWSPRPLRSETSPLTRWRGRDDGAPPRRRGREHPVVVDPMGAWCGDQRGEALDQFQRREQQSAGAVLPGSFEAHHKLSVPALLEAAVGQGRAGDVSTQPFQALTVPAGDADVCVDVEPPRLGAPIGPPVGRARQSAQAARASSGPPAHGDPARCRGGLHEDLPVPVILVKVRVFQ